jgi:hypothetical protein
LHSYQTAKRLHIISAPHDLILSLCPDMLTVHAGVVVAPNADAQAVIHFHQAAFSAERTGGNVSPF